MKTVRIADLVDEMGVISNERFVDCKIVGPAVLLSVKSRTVFSRCVFDSRDWRAVLWTRRSHWRQPFYTGVVALDACRFERCEFENVAVLVRWRERRQFLRDRPFGKRLQEPDNATDLDAENHARDLQVEHDDGSWRDREAPRE